VHVIAKRAAREEAAEDEHAPSPRQRLGVDRRQQAGDTRASELLEDRVERSRRGA